jgi:hypothetical protein
VEALLALHHLPLREEARVTTVRREGIRQQRREGARHRNKHRATRQRVVRICKIYLDDDAAAIRLEAEPIGVEPPGEDDRVRAPRDGDAELPPSGQPARSILRHCVDQEIGPRPPKNVAASYRAYLRRLPRRARFDERHEGRAKQPGAHRRRR